MDPATLYAIAVCQGFSPGGPPCSLSIYRDDAPAKNYQRTRENCLNAARRVEEKFPTYRVQHRQRRHFPQRIGSSHGPGGLLQSPRRLLRSAAAQDANGEVAPKDGAGAWKLFTSCRSSPAHRRTE